MKNFKNLPNFIHVAKFKDIFWNNNSDLYPSNVPNTDLYKYVENTVPTFINPYLGTCVLTGDYNHCFYNDTYYFLNKLDVIDLPTEQYKYQLDYDVFMNLIYKGGEIKGTLINTNREDILKECIQTTKPILSDPTNIYIFNKETSSENIKEINKQKLKKSINDSIEYLKGNKLVFKSWQISNNAYNEFIERLNNNSFKTATKGLEWLANKQQSAIYDVNQMIDPLYIIDTITPQKEDDWRNLIIKNLIEFLKKDEDFIISTQTSLVDHFSTNKPILGLKNKVLGNTELEGSICSNIDLTGLTDIVPLNNNEIEILTPNISPDKKFLTPYKYKTNKLITTPISVKRTGYLPINPVDKPKTYILKDRFKESVNYDDKTIGYYGNPSQKVKFDLNKIPNHLHKYGDVGYLWYLEKNNFGLVEYNWYPGNYETRISSSIWRGEETWWPFWVFNYDDIPPLGYLIFQLNKQRINWSGFKYKGSVDLNKISFRTGLNKNFFSPKVDNLPDWVNDGKLDQLSWYKYRTNELLWINSHPSFSWWTLNTDLFSWLTIAPTARGRFWYYQYKYNWYFSWHYLHFFPFRFKETYITKGYNAWEYPARVNHFDIELSFTSETNKKYITNPYHTKRIDKFLKDRESIIDSFSTYKEFDLDIPIKNGDLLFSSYEHELIKDPYWFLEIPYDIPLLRDNIDQLLQTWYFERKDEIRNTIKKNYWDTLVANKKLLGGLAEKKEYATNIQELLDEVKSLTIFYLYRGEYRIGILNKHKIHLTIDTNDPNQVVTSVNDKTFNNIDLYHIRNLENSTIDYKNENPISDTLKSQILNTCLIGLGNSKNNNIINYTEEDLKVGTYTFDLVGTDWHLIIHNGAYNLLPKPNTNVIEKTSTTTGYIKTILENPPSIYSRINQRSSLIFYGNEIPLTTKFDFSKFGFDNNVEFSLTDITPADKQGNMTNFRLVLNTPSNTDFIDECISILAKQIKGLASSSVHDNFLLGEKLSKLSISYEQDKMLNNLVINQKKLEYSRQREDLDEQLFQSKLRVGLNVGLAAAGATASGFASYRGTPIPALFAAGRAIGAITSIASDARFIHKGYDVQQSRLNEDERLESQKIAHQLYVRKQNYENDFKYQTVRLNQQVNSYINPNITDRDVLEEFNKNSKRSEIYILTLLPNISQQKEIDYIYSTFGCECVSTKFLNEPLQIYNGMDPGLYRFSKIEVGGIESPIADDSYLRDIIKDNFENGVKFEYVEHIPIQEIEIKTELIPATTVEFNLKIIPEWSRELWSLYISRTPRKDVIKTIKTYDHFGLKEDEYTLYKNQIRTDNDDHLFEDINKIIQGRDTGMRVHIEVKPHPYDTEEHQKILINKLEGQIVELNKKVVDFDQCEQDKVKKLQELEEAKSKIEQLKTEKESELNKLKTQKDAELAKLQQEKAKLVSELNKTKQEFDQHKEKTKEGIIATEKAFDERVKELQKQIADKDAKIKELEAEEQDLTKQLNNCEAQIAQLNQAKDTCDLINARKIKELEQKLKIKESAESAGHSPEFEEKLCTLLGKILASCFFIERTNIRPDGFSDFSDLCLYLAQRLNWSRATARDLYLEHYEPMKHVFNAMLILEQAEVIDKWMEVVGDRNWNKFVNYLQHGGDANGGVDKLIALTNEIKTKYTNTFQIQGLKAILDHLYHSIKYAQTKLEEQIKNDEGLDGFFKHYFPGQQFEELYKKVYHLSPNIELHKKVFAHNGCQIAQNAGKTIFDWFNDADQDIKVKVPETDVNPETYIPEVAPILNGKALNRDYWYPYLCPRVGFLTDEKHVQKGKVMKYLTATSVETGYFTRNNKKYAKVELIGDFYNFDKKSFNFQQTRAKIYMRFDTKYPSKGNLFKVIASGRDLLWQNREKIKLTEEDKQKIKSKQFWHTFSVRNWDMQRLTGKNKDISWNDRKDSTLMVNLYQLFGDKYVEDAYKLICIMDTIKSWWTWEGNTNSADGQLPMFAIQSRLISDFKIEMPESEYSIYSDPNFLEYFNTKQRAHAIIGENEFDDPLIFLNFVYWFITKKDRVNFFTLQDDINVGRYSWDITRNFLRNIDSSIN